jgi:hypothetical protein
MSNLEDFFDVTLFDEHTHMLSDESNILTFSGNSSHYDEGQIQPEQEHIGIFD